MGIQRNFQFLAIAFGLVAVGTGWADEKPIVGLIPKAQKPIKMDGKLDEWDGAFITPVHIGHPDFANRGGMFYFLWDEQNLYIGLRCLDQKRAHVAPDRELWNGDAVEFYLDTRHGDKLGGARFDPGTLHMFYTAFKNTEINPRLRVRDMPEFKDLKLHGAEVAAEKTPYGYTAEFKLPWDNFPNFKAMANEVIGIECELCSGDGGRRSDRTFVFSSPAVVGSPSAFGRVKLVDQIAPDSLKAYSRVLMPLSITRSANYSWLYATACLSPTIAKSVAKVEGKLMNASGKALKASPWSKQLRAVGFPIWFGGWEMFDLPAGVYTLEITAKDSAGKAIASRTEKFLHGILK
jgi:hypothetical protein